MRPLDVLRRLTLGCALAFVPLAVLAQAGDAGLARLRSEIDRLSTSARGVVGVGIIHLESGRELFVNGNEPFPMASTFKVPVAVQLLDKVDKGQTRLDSMITLVPADLHPGSGTLSNLFNDPGVSLSLRNLLELMLLISDNSATDLVLKAAGNGRAVNERLAALGVRGISVDRPTISLIADALGVKDLGPEREWTLAGFGAKARQVSPEAQKAAAAEFYKDTRDTATPEGMARLLQTVWNKQALSPASTSLLLDIMRRCETGPARIKGLLPPSVDVMHKTGTLGIGVANDVGIVQLPDAAGHVVVAVFVKQSTVEAAAQERVIAQIARAAYDYFLFTTR
ncbi:MAG: class A beta-lactamase [Gemmatimonadaceae bacterium]